MLTVIVQLNCTQVALGIHKQERLLLESHKKMTHRV